LFYLQLAVGRATEGIEQAKLAVESDPLSGYANAILGLTYLVDGRYTEAVEICQRAVELDTESFLARCSLHWALRFSGRFEESVAVGELALAMSGRHPWTMASLAMIFAERGKPADAQAVYAEMTARAQRCYVQPSQLAIAAAAAGMQDEAIRHSREAFEIRDPCCRLHFTKYWPDSARLRADPRFHEILSEFGSE
jgi:tetratricopeptide (TPR) repeat protein